MSDPIAVISQRVAFQGTWRIREAVAQIHLDIGGI